MQKLYYWKTNEIFEYIFDFIFDFILNLSYFYCTYIYIPLVDSNSVTRDVWKRYLQNTFGISVKVEEIYFYFISQIWIYYLNSIFFSFHNIWYKDIDYFYRKKVTRFIFRRKSY